MADPLPIVKNNGSSWIGLGWTTVGPDSTERKKTKTKLGTNFTNLKNKSTDPNISNHKSEEPRQNWREIIADLNLHETKMKK